MSTVIAIESGSRPEQPSSELDQVYYSLQGFWQDTTDDAIQMLIENDILVDYFAGAEGGQGIWDVAETCAGAHGAGPVMLVNYPEFGNEVLCWVLLELSATRFSFRAVDAVSDVHFVRVE